MKNSSHSNFSQDLLSELVSGYTENSSMPVTKNKTLTPNAQRMPVTTLVKWNLLVKKIKFRPAVLDMDITKAKERCSSCETRSTKVLQV